MCGVSLLWTNGFMLDGRFLLILYGCILMVRMSETNLCLLCSTKIPFQLGCRKFLWLFCGGDGNNVQGYIHHPNVLPLTSSILEYFAKDPPIQLYFDISSVSGIKEASNGIWSIVGGKASCRRIFSLEVVVLDAFSHTINKELEVIASLEYYDNGAHVEKTSDGEPLLLATHDGIEFASCERPSKVVQGRASFKLKISQDFELLKRIAGCKKNLAQENFEKMWCWLYPVAFTLSKDGINTIWSSTSPKWIEGFITKEEAEFSLQPSRGFQEPGTFVL